MKSEMGERVLRATVWERVMGYGGSELDAGSVALPEGEFAERAARRVVQWELGAAGCGPQSAAGAVRVILWWMIAVLVLGAVAVAVVEYRIGVMLLVLMVAPLCLVPLVRWRGRRLWLFAQGSAEEVLRAYTIEAIRQRNLSRHRAMRQSLLFSVLLIAGLLLVAHTLPALESMRGDEGGEIVLRALSIAFVMALLGLLGNVMVLWNGGNDGEIEEYRRKVLGEDWFAG